MEILSYFFSLRPGSSFSYYTILIVIAVLAFVGGITVGIIIKKNSENRALKKLFGGVPGKLKWLSLVLLILLATRAENIPYFSMRIWLYLTLLGLVYVFVKSIYRLVKVYPEERAFYFRNKAKSTVKTKKKVYSASKKRKN